MFPPTVALGFIIITMILTSLISLKHRILSLSLVSLLIGGIAPILIGSPAKSIFGLYSYLLALTVGTLWIARYSKWRILTTIALLIVSVYSIEYFFSSSASLRSYLRINKIGFTDSLPENSGYYLRFLARPNNTYQLFTGSNGSFSHQVLPESGNLLNATNVKKIALPIMFPNNSFTPPDTDKDTIPDEQDNCKNVVNSDQLDKNQ